MVRMRNLSRRAVRLLAATIAAWAVAAGGGTTATARPLTIAVGSDVTSLDPHFHNTAINHATGDHIYEPLTFQDAQGQVIPNLARSFKLIDDQTWEFELHPNVAFHDGTPLDPEDVAFTIARIPQVKGPSSYTHFIESVVGMERLSATTFRLKTRTPDPFLPFNLAGAKILSRTLHADGQAPDFNSGKLAIGTGPYRFASYARGDRLTLKRNDAWWGNRDPKTAQPWTDVTLRVISSDASRMAALLAGEIDLADRVPPDDLPAIRSNAALSLFSIRGHQVAYLFPDSTRDGPLPQTVDKKTNQPLATNPLRDRRVREALSLAINRRAISDTIMNGGSFPADQMVAPGAIGRDDTLPELPFDPARARALLAEAGYPDGWRWTIVAPNGLFSGDAKIAQAIAQMLTRVGIETRLETMVNAMFIPKINAREHPMFMMSYLSSTSVTVLRSVWVTKGSGPGNGVANRMNYSNPALDQAFLSGVTRMDDALRAKELAQAMRLGIQDLATIPVVFAGYNWATRKDRVVIEPNVLGFTQAMLIKPAK
jgi:peptide/nickel transport system substrate-binding protein